MRGNPQVQLDRLRESANDGARHFRTVYTFYLIVSLYIFAAVSSIDHEFLFRSGDAQMPIINVGVSVVWFFTVVPWILLVLHFNLLIQAMLLSRKINQYVSGLDRHDLLGHERAVALDLLFSLPLAHKLAGSDRRRSTRVLLGAMVFPSVVVLTPCILIYTQMQFLPYQEEVFVWLHRSAIIADVGLLWWIWPRVAMPNRGWCEWWKDRCRIGSAKDWDSQRSFVQYFHCLPAAVALVATVLSVIFTFIIADSPGGTMSRLIEGSDSWRNVLLPDRKYNLSGAVLVAEDPPPEILAAHYSATCQSDNTGASSRCDESSIDTGSFFWCKHAKALELNERHLVAANLSKAILCKIEFANTELRHADLSNAKLGEAILSNADLSEATLRDADLSGAKLDTAILSDADLSEARLHDADLWGAELDNAKLENAKLYGADLRSARLDKVILSGARLDKAILSGADLPNAKLHDANLGGADLRGANLWGAELHGADLSNARLHDANLWGADLRGAVLKETELRGANLWGAELHGADLSGAELHGADLSGAELHGADLSGAELHGAILWGAELHGANLSEAEFHGADLQQAKLYGAQLTRAELDLADLREIDFSGPPSREVVRVIEEISDPEVRNQALERLQRSEDEPLIEPGSINGAVLCEKDALYAGLGRSSGSELPSDTLYVVQCKARNKSNEYVSKLADELVDLACLDEFGYIAKGIAYRSISDWVLGPPLSRRLLRMPQCPGVTRGLEMLPEKGRGELGRMAAREIGASDP